MHHQQYLHPPQFSSTFDWCLPSPIPLCLSAVRRECASVGVGVGVGVGGPCSVSVRVW